MKRQAKRRAQGGRKRRRLPRPLRELTGTHAPGWTRRCWCARCTLHRLGIYRRRRTTSEHEIRTEWRILGVRVRRVTTRLGKGPERATATRQESRTQWPTTSPST